MAQETIHERAAAQFSGTAASYATSQGHAHAGTLESLVSLLGLRPDDRALDVGTGAGHMAFAVAPHVGEVVAFDLTPTMLEHVAEEAARRGLSHVGTVQGVAEKLPFEDGRFTVVTNRLSCHHYEDVPASVNEAARVLAPGGRFLLVDTIVPEDDVLDREINEIELLRDPSHGRNLRVSEWRKLVEDAGLTIVSATTGWYADGTRLDYESWVTRIRTPEANRPELRRRLLEPSDALRETLDITFEDGILSFMLPELTLLAVK